MLDALDRPTAASSPLRLGALAWGDITAAVWLTMAARLAPGDWKDGAGGAGGGRKFHRRANVGAYNNGAVQSGFVQ